MLAGLCDVVISIIHEDNLEGISSILFLSLFLAIRYSYTSSISYMLTVCSKFAATDRLMYSNRTVKHSSGQLDALYISIRKYN